MTRCEKANAYRRQDFNCAQCVLASFGDLTGLAEQDALAIAGALGGGIGGSHEEICGALSGAILVAGMLTPHVQSHDLDAKKEAYRAGEALRKRFLERFDSTRCGELLERELSDEDRTIADALHSRRICAVLIVEAARILEEYLREQGLCQ